MNMNMNVNVSHSIGTPQDTNVNQFQSPQPTNANQFHETTFTVLISGGLAGAVSRTATAPLDRIKVLLQAGCAVGGHKVTSVRGVFRFIYDEGKFKAFYRGNGTNIIKIAPETAIKFWAYENMKLVLTHNHLQPLSIFDRFVAGAIAGLTAQFCIYPLEITKTRLAISKPGEYKGIAHCLSQIVAREGPWALYKGLLPALSGVVPYSGVDLTVYSLLRDLYDRHYPYNNPSAVTLLACGAISSSCGQLVAYPLVVIRTRMQVQGMEDRPVVYTGMLDCLKKIYASEGIRGFYRGILPNFMKAIPAISISYLVYEKTKRYLSELRSPFFFS